MFGCRSCKPVYLYSNDSNIVNADFFVFFRDRKRKNYVGEDGNTKKIRTESGVRIPTTYKKNMYPL